jgi:hypothetical protein
LGVAALAGVSATQEPTLVTLAGDALNVQVRIGPE